jgi:hypothetical protein
MSCKNEVVLKACLLMKSAVQVKMKLKKKKYFLTWIAILKYFDVFELF